MSRSLPNNPHPHKSSSESRRPRLPVTKQPWQGAVADTCTQWAGVTPGLNGSGRLLRRRGDAIAQGTPYQRGALLTTCVGTPVEIPSARLFAALRMTQRKEAAKNLEFGPSPAAR